MKKLLLLPTILVLVSCQPSELDRCIASNLDNLKDIEELNLINKLQPNMKFSNIEKVALFSIIYNEIEDGNINANEPILAQMNPSPSCINRGNQDSDYSYKWGLCDLIIKAFRESYDQPVRNSMESTMESNIKSNKEYIKIFQADFIKLQRGEVEKICNSQGIY